MIFVEICQAFMHSRSRERESFREREANMNTSMAPNKYQRPVNSLPRGWPLLDRGSAAGFGEVLVGLPQEGCNL